MTASSAATKGCVMMIMNLGAFTITLDANGEFETSGNANVALGPLDGVTVVSDGNKWYQMTNLQANS
jgi:hypothetical protein